MYRLSIAVVVVLLASPGIAQSTQRQTASPHSNPGQPVAVAGNPFGVFQLELPLPNSSSAQLPNVKVSELNGRVHYPVVSFVMGTVDEPRRERPRRIGRPGGALDRIRSAIDRNAKKEQVPVGIRVAGLFTGDESIDVQLSGDVQQRFQLSVNSTGGDLSRQLLNQWWGDYIAFARNLTSEGDFPSLVQKYLVSTLARRLQLPPHRVDDDSGNGEEEQGESSQPLKTLALLGAIEPLRDEILQEILDSDGTELSSANLPVPLAPQRQASQIAAPDDVQIEPIARRVPPECFYIRFGEFQNFVWFQDLTDRYGGDIAQAVTIRGVSFEAAERMERMLATKMTTVAKMFGGNVVSDLAVIGTDLYVKEGASLGAIIKGVNIGILRSAIDADRRSVVSRIPTARLQSVQIGGRDVSLLSTPDNSIRSFLFVDGDYLFVTTSSTLMRRFLEVGEGAASLADSSEFQWSRKWMPPENNYTMFGYFSPQFFMNLVGPQYQLELRRRLKAIGQLEVAGVATLAAQAEGIDGSDLSAMQSAGLLPAGFTDRADGAIPVRLNDQWVDSLRGSRGSFLPIADVAIDQITAAELAEYEQVANFYRDSWQTMDPMQFGIRRFKADDRDAEIVTLEAHIAPFDADKYGWIARQLAEPTNAEIRLPVSDVVQVQLYMRGDTFLGGGAADYQLFGGIKDMVIPDFEDTGVIETFFALRSFPAYLGAWPMPQILDRFGVGNSAPDRFGFTRLLGGLWRWENGEFSLLSFNRDVLSEAIESLGVIESTDHAQARLKTDNLSGTALSEWINDYWFDRALRASVGNAMLLNMLQQQLNVSPSECLAVAANLLDVAFKCPLGGEYECVDSPAEASWWHSSSWPNSIDNASAPAGYSAPWLEWFRGCRLHVTQQAKSLSVVGTIELEMQEPSIKLRKEEEQSMPSLNFDVFSLPMQLFGGEGAQSTKSSKRSF